MAYTGSGRYNMDLESIDTPRIRSFFLCIIKIIFLVTKYPRSVIYVFLIYKYCISLARSIRASLRFHLIQSKDSTAKINY